MKPQRFVEEARGSGGTTPTSAPIHSTATGRTCAAWAFESLSRQDNPSPAVVRGAHGTGEAADHFPGPGIDDPPSHLPVGGRSGDGSG